VDSTQRAEGHQVMARRVRQARREKTPTLHQAEAAKMFGLSQSAYSRLENGETRNWKPSAIDGAALLLGISHENVKVGLSHTPHGSEHVVEALDEILERLDNMEAVLTAAADVGGSPSTLIIADLVKRKRGELGLSAMDAATLMGVELATMVRFEYGYAMFDPYARQVADFLGVPVEALRELIAAESDQAVSDSLDSMYGYLDERAGGLRRWESGIAAANVAIAEIENTDD